MISVALWQKLDMDGHVRAAPIRRVQPLLVISGILLILLDWIIITSFGQLKSDREGLEYRQLIDGWNPLNPIDESEEIAARPKAFLDIAIGLINSSNSLSRKQVQNQFMSRAQFTATDLTPPYGGGQEMQPAWIVASGLLERRGFESRI